MPRESFDLIYSIGEDCACATYMKRNKLRSVSGPFDWLTHADFDTRVELILSDFENFLNFEDLKFLEKDERMFNDPDCDYYENTRTGFYFFHNFPTGIKLELSYPQVLSQFQKRCRRFTNLIHKAQKPLLIWFSQYQKLSDEKILTTARKLSDRFGKKIHFAIIEHEENLPRGKIVQKSLTPQITRWYLNSIVYDEIGLPTTFGDETTCTKVFSGYRLVLPWKQRLLNCLLRITVKTGCALSPSRKIKKKLKGLIK